MEEQIVFVIVLLLRLMINYPTIIPLLIYLAVIAYYDMKYREVTGHLLLSGLPGVAVGLVVHTLIKSPAYLFSMNTLFSLVIASSVIATSFLLARRGQIGVGDVPVVALVSLALFPYTVRVYGIPIPLILLTFLLGVFYVVVEVIGSVLHNIRRFHEFAEITNDCGLALKLYYFFVSKVFTVREFKNLKYYFPVKYEGSRRLTAKVGVEPLEGREYEVSGNLVLAVKGIPFVASLFTGAVLSTLWLLLTELTRC